MNNSSTAGSQTEDKPRRSLGFWIMSPWRHVMVTMWCFPMFMVAFYDQPGKLLLGWIFGIAADIVAACRAPDSRLKHRDMLAFLDSKKQICLVTWKDIWVQLAVLGTIISYILYLFYRSHSQTIEPDVAKGLIVTAMAVGIAFVSIKGVRARRIDQLSPGELPFWPNQKSTPIKQVLLFIWGWPGIFYFVFLFACRGYLWATKNWEGTAILLLENAFMVYAIFLLFIVLIPPAYAMSKLKPYQQLA